jgi:hypothetical protein
MIQKETISFEREQFSTRQEIRDLEMTYTSIKRSLHVVIDSAVRRAVIASTNYIFNHSTYLNDAEDDLLELILNGTLYSQNVEIMQNNTLTKWINDLEDFYRISKNYNVSIALKNISLALNDSFHIEFKAIAYINISKISVASLSKITNISERTSIIDFEDPFYLLNITRGGASKIIRKPEYPNFTELILTGSGANGWCYGEITNSLLDSDKSKILVKNDISGNESQADDFCGVIFKNGDETQLNTTYLKNSSADVESLLSNYNKILLSGEKNKVWNISNFIDFVQQGYYYNSSSGPSFFDRLEGKNYCSYCSTKNVGLESFINKNLLYGLGLAIDQDASSIDYLYANHTIGDYIGLNENSAGSEFYYFRIDDLTFQNYFE